MPPMMAQAIAMRAQNRAQGQAAGGGPPAGAAAPGAGASGGPAPGGAAAGGPAAGGGAGAGAWQGGGGGNWQRPNGAGPGGPGGPGNWQGGGGRMGGGDPQQMLERLPPMPLTELKPGDAVIVAGPSGTDVSRLNAIALVAGVEPILTAPRQAGPESVGGSWNLDINIIP